MGVEVRHHIAIVLVVLGAVETSSAATATTSGSTTTTESTSSTISNVTLVAALVPVMVGGLSLISLLFYLFCRHRLGGEFDTKFADFLPGARTNYGVETNIDILPIRVTKNYVNENGGGFPYAPEGHHLQLPPHGSSPYLNSVQVNGLQSPVYGPGSIAQVRV